MATIDWDKAAQQKSVLEPDGNKQTYMAVDGGVAPVDQFSPLPEIGGLLGGVGGALLSRSPAGARVGQTAGQAFVRTLIPSLAGSTAGTIVGLGGEGLLQGTTGQRAMSALIENAAWDVGGNLAFSVGGKVIRLGKDALDSLGITRAGTFDDARLAAQRYLESRDATLTRGQLTGGKVDQFLESIAASGTGSDVFAKQQQKVGEALNQGTKEVLNTLNTSETFKAALRADEPLSRAAGENFQNLINIARTEFKDKFRPFYESLSKDYGIYVDMRPLKQQAEAELKRLERTKFAGAGAARKEVLDDILKQEDLVEFGAAHDLRSAFSSAANDLKIPGAGTTSKGAAFSKYASDIEKQMDSAMQVVGLSKKRAEDAGLIVRETPATSTTAMTTGATGFNPATVRTDEAKQLLQTYKETQAAYKQGQEGLFNATITQAMKESPSKVGAYVFDLADTGKATDLFRAISEVDKYAKTLGKDGGQLMNDFKYGFLEQSMATPEKIAKLADNIEKDPEMRRSFYKLFASEANQLKDILNAAKIGLDNLPGGEKTYIRNKALLAGGQALTLGVGYIALPNEITDKINLPETLATGAVFVLTPRLIAKASTNKEAISALADLTKASQNPKFGGAAAAKLADRLNAAGIIDNEYINEVNQLFGSPDARQTSQPTPEPQGGRINWDEVAQ